MSLRNLNLKKAYSSDSDDIVNDFYVPVLGSALEYSRIAGFFSSSSLAIAAKGIAGLVGNEGAMRLIVSPKFNKRDLEVLIESHLQPEKFIEENFINELGKLEDQFVRDHVRALGWMVANGKLEIRVATILDLEGNVAAIEDDYQSGIFHQKVGILRDQDDDQISFSGSINETAFGWMQNIEEFKVFRSWEPHEKDYILADIEKFNKFWNNQSEKVRISAFPEAVREKLIELAPDDVGKLNLSKWYRRRSPAKAIRLFEHQDRAIANWVKSDFRGIFEMATGTGKTFAALGCLQYTNTRFDKLVVVITCPYQHLGRQWERDITTYGIDMPLIMADSSQPSWKDRLAERLIDVSIGQYKRLIIITTHRTFSSEDFQFIINQNLSGTSALLIADEVHGVGADQSKQGLTDNYNLRLGLSATPRRWFDDLGTETIFEYFSGTVFEFGLKEAISIINPATGQTFLTPYRYVPIFITLSEDEIDAYSKATTSITKLFFSASKEERKGVLDNLIFKRANIIKNAIAKYSVLARLIGEVDLRWTIIYCTPQQIDKVMKILDEKGISKKHRFTMDEGTKPDKVFGGISERDYVLQRFAAGDFTVLVAMKCLDEGVDVPPARNAILLASSGNPREYIQRIGRVIRRYPGKDEARIYDLIVKPDYSKLPTELRTLERTIFQKEMRRSKEIAMLALNNAQAMEMLFNAER